MSGSLAVAFQYYWILCGRGKKTLIFELRFLLGMVADGFYKLWPTKCQQEFETE
jgi:hypothetical protein